MERLISAIGKNIRLHSELRLLITENFTSKNIPKNDQILREDQLSNTLFFLESGVVRSFYYHKDKEVTSWLYGENQFFTSWYSFINQSPSFEYLEALEDCRVQWISRDRYEDLLSKSPIIERFARILVEEQLAFLDYFYKGFLFMSAKEKYDLLLSVFPDVTQKVNLGYIASLLGISQETLSRIRSQK